MTHENVYFSNGNYERRSSKLAVPNAELYLKVATVIYGFHLLAARMPEVASKLERHLFYSKHRNKLSTDYPLGDKR